MGAWSYARSVAAILRLGDEVAAALSSGTPVVALESTIFSQLGLPEPSNRECFERVEAAVRAGGAVPALCGVLDGQAVVGAGDDQGEGCSVVPPNSGPAIWGQRWRRAST